MLDLERHRVTVALTIVLTATGALASGDQLPAASDARALLVAQLEVSSPQPKPLYEVRAIHDPNGTGRFYMGREIAQVMGPDGVAWLDRPEREDEEHPKLPASGVNMVLMVDVYHELA